MFFGFGFGNCRRRFYERQLPYSEAMCCPSLLRQDWDFVLFSSAGGGSLPVIDSVRFVEAKSIMVHHPRLLSLDRRHQSRTDCWSLWDFLFTTCASQTRALSLWFFCHKIADHRIRLYGRRVTDSQDTSFENPASNPVRELRRALRSTLTAALAETLTTQKLSQVDAARICATDQPTLSKVLRGRNHGVTVDKLLCWLAALGCDIEVHVSRTPVLNTGEVRTVIFE